MKTRNIIFSILLLFGLFSCKIYEGKKIRVPQKMIQEKTEKKFPISKNYIIAKATLKNPKVSVKDDRIIIDMNYSVSAVGSSEEGSIKISSNVKFDNNTKSIYLIDPQVNEIKNKNDEILNEDRITKILSELIIDYVTSKPVYQIEEDEEKILQKIKNITIEKGKIFIHT